MSYPWRYDETIQIGTDYRNPEEVRVYDEQMMTLRDVGAEVKNIQKALALPMDATVWEIGAGTGECALALASAAKHVYATDVSPAMLDYARHKAGQRGVTNVTFEAGGFLSGFRPLHPVNGIVTQLALHHLPDFWKSIALAGIAASLCPKGRLYLRDVVFPSTTGDYDAYFKTVVDDIRSHAGDAMAERTIRHIRKEFSTLDWVLEGMIVRAGLRIVEKDGKGFLSVYVCEK